MTKVQSHMMLVPPNVTMKLLNVRKKIRVTLNVTKVWLNVMLVLPNVTIEQSKVRKNKEPPNVTKLQSHVILLPPNMMMELLNVRKKNNGNTECDKSTVKCNVGIA